MEYILASLEAPRGQTYDELRCTDESVGQPEV